MHASLPSFTSELYHARQALRHMRYHFARTYFSGGGDITCPRALNRHTSQGLMLILMLGCLLVLAFVADLLKLK